MPSVGLIEPFGRGLVMGAWIVGRNLAGHMPESEVAAFESWEDAAEYYVAEARDYADRDDEATFDMLPSDASEAAAQGYSVKRDTYDGGLSFVGFVDYGDDTPVMLATVDSILADDGPRPGEPHGMIVEDGAGRRISFWLDWSEDSEPDGES